MAWSPVNRHAAHEDRANSCRLTEMFRSFQGIFTPIVSLMSRGTRCKCLVLFQTGKMSSQSTSLYESCQFISDKSHGLCRRRKESLFVFQDMTHYLKMDTQNLHLLLIADFISATYQGKIVKQNGNFERTSMQTLWTECWVTSCWEDTHSAAGYGGWIVFTPQMTVPELAVRGLGVSVWQFKPTPSVITEFTLAQMYCNRPQSSIGPTLTMQVWKRH